MKQNVRLVAFLLAMVMLFVFSGCESAFLSTSGSTPTANSIPKTTPSDTEDGKAKIDAWIAQLVAATTEASDHYSAALEVLTNDFAAKPEGTDSPALEEMTQAMAAARDARVAALSAMVDDLNQLDSKDTDAVASKFAEAAALINHAHTYGEMIYHSRNSEGINCAEADCYQICTLCNDLKWTKGEHQWYYSRNKDTHQMCCRVCDATEASSAHDTNDQGQCNVCNYKLKANILLIEGIEGEAQQLSAMMDAGHTVTTVNIKDSEKMPTTLEALQAYHEVILCNVANADMPDGFAELLQSYVRDYGGGLLTVGGDKAYQLEDMGGTTYEELLPVEMTVPSMAVMIIVDTSGSMWYPGTEEPYETSKLFAAVQGAEACLDVLCENDYVGVMSLGDYYTETIELTPRTQRAQIIDAINSIELGSGTIFEGALVTARRALLSNTQVDKRHIIIITDGLPGDPDPDMYLNVARQNAKDGITMSVVGLQCDNYAKRHMRELVKAGGMNEKHFYDVQELSQVANVMRESMAAPELRDIQCQRYMPSIVIDNSITENLTVENMPVLDGAYYSKLKEGATEVLGSPYGPLYAQWNYGKGMVGSFMCDLNGTWSAEFLEGETGKDILNNIILELANPPENPEDSPKDTF